MSAGICECGHTKIWHRGGPHKTDCKKCDCTEFADLPATPKRRSFAEMAHAYQYAASAAAVQGKRWLVCKRVGKWYAIEPGLANAVRGNPNWPGAKK